MLQWTALLKKSTQAIKNTSTADPLIKYYTDLHLAFATIHPYADGNGRMTRLLANLPLLQAGWAPLVIQLSERRNYIALLGDYTLARGPIKHGELLVLASQERDQLQSFFEEQYGQTLSVIQKFHSQQAKRSGDE